MLDIVLAMNVGNTISKASQRNKGHEHWMSLQFIAVCCPETNPVEKES